MGGSVFLQMLILVVAIASTVITHAWEHVVADPECRPLFQSSSHSTNEMSASDQRVLEYVRWRKENIQNWPESTRAVSFIPVLKAILSEPAAEWLPSGAKGSPLTIEWVLGDLLKDLMNFRPHETSDPSKLPSAAQIHFMGQLAKLKLLVAHPQFAESRNPKEVGLQIKLFLEYIYQFKFSNQPEAPYSREYNWVYDRYEESFYAYLRAGNQFRKNNPNAHHQLISELLKINNSLDVLLETFPIGVPLISRPKIELYKAFNQILNELGIAPLELSNWVLIDIDKFSKRTVKTSLH